MSEEGHGKLQHFRKCRQTVVTCSPVRGTCWSCRSAADILRWNSLLGQDQPECEAADIFGEKMSTKVDTNRRGEYFVSWKPATQVLLLFFVPSSRDPGKKEEKKSEEVKVERGGEGKSRRASNGGRRKRRGKELPLKVRIQVFLLNYFVNSSCIRGISGNSADSWWRVVSWHTHVVTKHHFKNTWCANWNLLGNFVELSLI